MRSECLAMLGISHWAYASAVSIGWGDYIQCNHSSRILGFFGSV